ncbi:MAG: UDP-3-O-acyl-N-acetylglucosamine deacetylase [Candidatus Lernaella stagnicola]|nr:UDP-3-O-acyl-N-acetylglucosamine deacetylase [Candidatus Lernaella stagnicola]
MFWQRTLAAAVSCTGVGLHSGGNVTVTIRPAPADNGIVFCRTDLPGRQRIRAVAANVGGTNFATTLMGDGFVIGTIEHLMAALSGHGVDNAIVEVDGDEIPIMDGSAAAFSYLVDSAGVMEQSTPRRYIQILKPVSISEGDKRAALFPADGFALTYEIDYDHPIIRRQRFDVVVTRESFRTELAAARTFGFLAEVTQMRENGFANGGSLDNAVVIGNYSVINNGGLRYPNEFVRHKALDAMGDLYLAGYPILGRMHGVKSGHALNHKLVMAMLRDKKAWRLVEGQPAAIERPNATIHSVSAGS